MSTMVSEIYEALLEAGASQPKAKAATEAMASEHLATKEDMQGVKNEIHGVKAELLVMKWMLAVILVSVVIPAIKAIVS